VLSCDFGHIILLDVAEIVREILARLPQTWRDFRSTWEMGY